jgi:hypothetical protein
MHHARCSLEALLRSRRVPAGPGGPSRGCRALPADCCSSTCCCACAQYAGSAQAATMRLRVWTAAVCRRSEAPPPVRAAPRASPTCGFCCEGAAGAARTPTTAGRSHSCAPRSPRVRRWAQRSGSAVPAAPRLAPGVVRTAAAADVCPIVQPAPLPIAQRGLQPPPGRHNTQPACADGARPNEQGALLGGCAAPGAGQGPLLHPRARSSPGALGRQHPTRAVLRAVTARRGCRRRGCCAGRLALQAAAASTAACKHGTQEPWGWAPAQHSGTRGAGCTPGRDQPAGRRPGLELLRTGLRGRLANRSAASTDGRLRGAGCRPIPPGIPAGAPARRLPRPRPRGGRRGQLGPARERRRAAAGAPKSA